MRLVACRECGSGVAMEDAPCPTCGAAPPTLRSNAIWILALAALGVSLSGIVIPLLL
jgi:hypothetical protein